MKDGTYIFYIIQAMSIAETKYGKPKDVFYPIKQDNKEWFNPDFDVFDPWDKDKYGHKLYSESSDDKHLCWAKTGYSNGWFNLDYAHAALKRARAKKYYDREDGYGKLQQRTKYKFRIKKVIIIKMSETLIC